MIIGISIIVLGAIGIIAAILLFIAAKKFYVYEDPKIGEIEEPPTRCQLRRLWFLRMPRLCRGMCLCLHHGWIKLHGC